MWFLRKLTKNYTITLAKELLCYIFFKSEHFWFGYSCLTLNHWIKKNIFEWFSWRNHHILIYLYFLNQNFKIRLRQTLWKFVSLSLQNFKTKSSLTHSIHEIEPNTSLGHKTKNSDSRKLLAKSGKLWILN